MHRSHHELDLNKRPRVVLSHHILQLLDRLERHPRLVHQFTPSILTPIFAIRIQQALDVRGWRLDFEAPEVSSVTAEGDGIDFATGGAGAAAKLVGLLENLNPFSARWVV